MKQNEFTPQSCDNLESVQEYSEYTENTEIQKHTNRFEEVLRGEAEENYDQASWMGRGCSKKLPSGDFFLGKGVGPGPGSEKMRQFLDQLWKERAGNDSNGGCIRMPTESDYPLLLQFIKDELGLKIMDPRPEGFAIFGALFREGMSGEIYRKIGVPSTEPVKLFRNKVNPPFSVTDGPKGVEDYIRSKIHTLMTSTFGEDFCDDTVPIRLEENTYFDMDGGILVRKAKTPYRIANLHAALLDNDEELVKHLVDITKNGLNDRSLQSSRNEIPTNYKLASVLGQTAGKLFTHHIVHGQFNIHYQNVSLLGELADFDSTVFLEAYPDLDSIETTICNTKLKTLYTLYWKTIKQGEDKYSVPMRPFVQEDFEQTIGGKSLSSANMSTLSSNALRQIYDLYTQSLRCIDLLSRQPSEKKPGSVLSSEEITQLKQFFVESFFDQFENEESINFLKRVLKEGYECFRNQALDKRGQTTIYGLHYPKAPLSHLIETCDNQHLEFIQKDADELFNLLKNLIN